MKKLIIPAIALFVLFCSIPNSYANTYYSTFEVAEITSEGIILKDSEGGRFLVEKDPSTVSGGLNVGDSVRYDPVRNVLKKNPWQPAEITKMTDRTITLQLRNDKNVDVNMRSKYSNNFNKGDQVHYKASTGQIKKSNLIELEKE